VVPERDGIITSWRIQSQELYLDAEGFANPDLTVVEFHLFPICGNLSDNTYTYDGQQYTLKQHGFARDWKSQTSTYQEPVSPLCSTVTSRHAQFTL